ncbi:DNA transposase THAP9 [Merluccius polli]|uniref:DNA transposase THAP9 n=1 Tax=Merluccius polli TaxID=89951 RepID=A0AA47MR12_MERPO|nr:DNA transposase THAP9 [Merluccius polli]
MKMPDFCAAYGCANRRCLEARTHGITFHRFPKNGERRRKWEVALRRDGFAASDTSLLCSEHFRSEDFDRTGQTVRVKDGVVPTIFNFPAHLQRSAATRSTATSGRAQDNLPNPMDLMPDGSSEERRLRLKGQRKRQATDHLYGLPASPKAIKAKLSEASARVRILEREKSNALRREKRAKNNMQALLEELKEKNLINEELKDKLECYSDLPVHLLSRQGVEYTKAQRDFALTLHLHGPKAYLYLRETLDIHLPHPSSLQRWLSSLDARPGLNKLMLDMLERRRQEDEGKYGCVTLMLDAMSIKSHVQHDPQTQTMSGYVDMGDRLNETDIASEALVFMVVGLQGYWKAPIAYYLTKSLTPETQRVLVEHALEELHHRQIRVVCMTMDGHASNVSMCTQLGCKLKADPCEPLKTHFPHPITHDKVFVMMDACHMLKLTRNIFLSVLGFVINIDTLMSMVPVLLEGQRYVLTYRFSQDHLELLFNSIRASGGWNNNPNARQFKYVFRKLMARCGVVSRRGNVTAQDDTESLTATIDTSTSLSAVDVFSAAGGEDLPSPFADIPALVHDHSYLPVRFNGLVDNALVYISGFVVRRALKKLSCDVCRASLVTDAASAIKDQSYHLLSLKNNGGLVIPSEGTVRVVRAAEWVIRQASASCRQSRPIKLLEIMYIVRKRIGSEDVFELGEHISDTQYGIDSHHHMLLALVVSLFFKLRLHHIAKMTTLSLQRNNMRQKLNKTVLFKGH